MAASDFFSRWAKPDAPASSAEALPDASPPPAAPVVTEAPPAPETLTSDDAARLTGDSDFTPFMARGVDESVKRLALKKLFAEPHFNVMDGLDIYVGDYNTF